VVATVPVGGSSAQLSRGGSINLSREQIRELRIVLRDKGFDIGEPDGVMGTRTKEALIAFQRQEGFRATGQIDVETVTALGIKGDFGQRGGNPPSTTGQGNRPDNAGRNDNRDRDNSNQARDRNGQPSTGRDRDDSQRSGNQDRGRPATTGQGQDNRDSRSDKDRNDQPATTGQGQDQPTSRRDGDRNTGPLL
jgi:peptidoglycan hydrolase-like protein with peptidoglycan-binding domain